MSDNRPPVYREGDFWIVRASAFGQCDVALARHAAGMQGAEIPAFIREAMDFGTAHEQHVIDRLPEPDIGPRDWYAIAEVDELCQWGEVDDTGQLLLELTVGKVKVRCHPDGIAQNRQMRTTGGDVRVLEVKCMAEGNDPQKGMYDWQFGIEMAVTGLPLLLAIGWKVPDAENSRVRKLNRIETREIDTPPKTLVEIKTRALRLGKLFDLAVEGEWDAVGKCDRVMYPCPFYDLHDDKVFAQVTDEAKREEAEKLIDKIRDMKATEAEGKKAAEARRVLESELAGVVGWGFDGAVGPWRVKMTMTEVEEQTRTTTTKAHTRRVVKIEEMK